MSNRFIEGLEQVTDGRYKIRESYTASMENCVEVKDIPSKIVESDGIEYSADKSYRFKVWELASDNKNGRKYDKVIPFIMESKYVTIGLTDHPEGDKDGDPSKIWAVQRDPQIIDGWLTIEIVFVKGLGEVAEDVLKKGGPICISSSCLGQVDYEGYVTLEGFELERYGDWVLNPSNGVKHFENTDIQESVEDKKEPIVETIVEKETDIKSKITESNLEINKEKNNMSDLNEKLLASNVKAMIRTVKSMKESKEKLDVLENDVLPLFEGAESQSLNSLKETVDSVIASVKEDIMSRAEKADSLEESVSEKDAKIKEFEVNLEKCKSIISSLKKRNQISEASLANIKKGKVSEGVEKSKSIILKEKKKGVILESNVDELIQKVQILEANEAELIAKAKDAPKKVEKVQESEDQKAIREYVQDMIKLNPDVKSIRRDIIQSSKSLEEAQVAVLDFIDGLEEAVEPTKSDASKFRKGLKENTSAIKTISQVIREKRDAEYC